MTDKTDSCMCLSGKNRNSCKVTQHPSSRTRGRDRSPISDTIIKVVKKMTVPVTLLHVTPMGAFRSDAHVGTWNDNPSVPDCSHWCLPGVPDTWNEILLSFLLSKSGVLLQWTIEVASLFPYLASSIDSKLLVLTFSQFTWDLGVEEVVLAFLFLPIEEILPFVCLFFQWQLLKNQK